MEEKKQTSNLRVEVEHPDGGSVWLPADRVSAWKSAQEKLKQGDPETLAQFERMKERLRKRVAELMDD